MAASFVSYEAIDKTESFDEEHSAPIPSSSQPRSRLLTILVVLLSVVGASLLVVSTYSPASKPVVTNVAKSSAFSAAATAGITDLHKSSSSKKDTATIDFTETYNPTPVKLHPTSKPVHEQRQMKSSKKDTATIDFTESFNPTPVKLHPTSKPVHEQRQMKSSKKDTATVDTINFTETYNPTPEEFNKDPKHETHNPTSESKHRQRQMKIDEINFTEVRRARLI